MNKVMIYGGSAVVLAIAFWVLLLGGEKPEETSEVGVFSYAVKIERGTLNLVVSSNGVVEPINKVEIKSKASGQIEELGFIEGQEVSRGDLLLKLDQRTTRNDVDQAKADLAVAEANLKQMENNLGRSRELFSKGLVSEQEQDQANLEFVRAQAQLVKARAVLSSAQERLADTRIVAPISGVILTKSVELGQIISSGTSNVSGGTLLATIADMEEVYVLANVDEVDIGKVNVGQRATVIADAFPDDRFIGQVERVSPQGKTTQTVTTFTVVILVRNRGARLKAGMSTSVDVEIFNRSDVLLVPNEALLDPRNQQTRELMDKNGLVIPVDSSANRSSLGPESNGQSGPAGFQRPENMSDEERAKFREQMRQRFESMTPEQRQQMAQRFGGGGGGGFGGRRRSQETNVNEVKWRVVMVKEQGAFKPRLTKVGVGNFDATVVLEGLQEGEEVEIKTISRAKIAQERMNERMRSQNTLGGSSGPRR